MKDYRKTQKENLLGFLMTKLNSDMSPAASDLFIPMLIKELGELLTKHPELKS